VSKHKIICLTVSLLGAITSLIGAFAILQGVASLSWSSTEGYITRAETSHGGGSKRIQKFFQVTYSYTVNNQYFTGNRIAFMFDRGTHDSTMQYSDGQQVTVYYNPTNPSSAVLLKGIQSYYWYVSVLGVIFLLLGWTLYRGVLLKNGNGR
jgi:Protein of unknown function (DUF3592)